MRERGTELAPGPVVATATTVGAMAPAVIVPPTLMRPRLFFFVPGLAGASKQRLKIGNRIGQDGWMASPLYREHQRTVQRGQFVRPKPFGLALSQTHASNALAVPDFVVQGNSVTPEMDAPG
jgi:hypothetical protein